MDRNIRKRALRALINNAEHVYVDLKNGYSGTLAGLPLKLVIRIATKGGLLRMVGAKLFAERVLRAAKELCPCPDCTASRSSERAPDQVVH